jgi:hypothetical protein
MDFVLPATNNGVNLLAVLDEKEGGHRLDLVFFSDILLNKETILVQCHKGHLFGRLWYCPYLQLVNIHLQEDGTREPLGVLSEHWGDDTARSAP